MKYQKSMLKIYGSLLNKGEVIEELIKKPSAGMTSAHGAITLMEKNGLVEIKTIDKQKQISLKKDIYTFQFKNFIDSIKFKEIDESLKYSIRMFIERLNKGGVKMILLFGSSLYSKSPKDLNRIPAERELIPV